MKVKNVLATLPLVVAACGGEESNDNLHDNEPGFGIWNGEFSSGVIDAVSGASGQVSNYSPTSSNGVGLYTSDNRAFFYTDLYGGVAFIGQPGVSLTYNLIFNPEIYINGSNTDNTSDFSTGQAWTSHRLFGAYDGYLNGSYVLLFDDDYLQAADLNHLAGSWTESSPKPAVTGVGAWNFDIQSNGGFSVTTESCSGVGNFTTIDPTKNEYDVDLTLSNCSNSAHNGTYNGIAATIETNSANDTILMMIYDSNYSFFLKPLKN